MILTFFFFFKIFSALISKPFAIITSKKIFFSSSARVFETRELIATTPPKALTGSQANEFLKEIILFFSDETPQGLACLMITVP